VRAAQLELLFGTDPDAVDYSEEFEHQLEGAQG
jgi:hypothetical protein